MTDHFGTRVSGSLMLRLLPSRSGPASELLVPRAATAQH